MMSRADEFLDLFSAVYLRFCRRSDDGEPRLTMQMSAVLQHLALSGPLTIGEMALHFDRAQSVVSEIVDGLAAKGLLARMRDARDRRRVLVWLTEEGEHVLRTHRQVLDLPRLAAAMAALGPERSRDLVETMRVLVRAAEDSYEETKEKEHECSQMRKLRHADRGGAVLHILRRRGR